MQKTGAEHTICSLKKQTERTKNVSQTPWPLPENKLQKTKCINWVSTSYFFLSSTSLTSWLEESRSRTRVKAKFCCEVARKQETDA